MTAANAAWGGAVLTVLVASVDVTCDTIRVGVDRSKNRLWDAADAGTCQVTLRVAGDAQPASRGPVGAPVRVRWAYGTVSRWVFTGVVQKRRLIAAPDNCDQLVLDCVDEFEKLARLNVRAGAGASTVGGGESVEQRLARWLNQAGSTTARSLGSSTFTCPATLIDGNILRQLQVTALADGGDFYIAGDGTVTFLPWNWRNDVTAAAAVFSDRLAHDWVPYSTATYNDDLDEVQNDVPGIRRDDGGATPVLQTATNPSSVSTFGARGDPLDDLELSTDGQVATRVANVVSVAAQPSPRFDSIVVQPQAFPSVSWPRTIPVTFGSLVAANRLWDDGTESALYGHVIGEVWTVTPNDATVEYRVTGTGAWDAIGPPRLPIALERCPDGSIRIPAGYPCDQTSTVVVKKPDGTVCNTYPPGSLCHCGTVFLDEDCTIICLDDGTTQVCMSFDPRLDAILWFDVLDPGPSLREKIEGTPIGPLEGFAATRVGVIPGDFDAIDAGTTAGGRIGGAISGGPTFSGQISHKLDVADLTGGWSVEFWLYLTVDVPTDYTINVIDLDSITIRLTSRYTPGTSQIEVDVYDSANVVHHSLAIHTVSLGDWHKYVVSWDPTLTGDELVIFIDGVEGA